MLNEIGLSEPVSKHVIIRDFTELNDSIHESIKLWCLSTSIGIDLQHLRRLENDRNSRALGFDVDARLQIATSQNQAVPSSLEFGEPDLREKMGDMKQYEGRFGVFACDGKPVLVEYRSYSPDSPVSVDLDERTCDLVNRLANLLHQPKELVFRTPCCRGWVRQTQQNRVAFMFEIPGAVDPCPVSLLKVLSSSDWLPPSLSQRFQLALKLSRCISQLQLVKWVHESFRSENILFFPNIEKKTASARLEDRINLSEPWVLGFEFSRPEMYFSHGHADACLTRDIYRHPDCQQHPTQPFNKMHNIYALGVILLEIGLWKQALSMERSGFAKVAEPDAIRKYMIRQARKHLGAKMGEKYKNIVLNCLEGDFGVVNDTKEDLKLQQAFRAQVVDVLQNQPIISNAKRT